MSSFQCFEVVFKDHQWQRKINSKFIKNISTTNTWSAVVTGYNEKATTKQFGSSASSLFHSINVFIWQRHSIHVSFSWWQASRLPRNLTTELISKTCNLSACARCSFSILIFVRSGAGVRRDQSRHLVFMKTIRQSGKLTRDRNQFSRDVNGRSTNESYICRTSALRLNLKDFAHAKSEFTITDKGKGMGFTILFLRICTQILVSIYGAILLWLFCKRLARTSFI